MQTLPGHEVIDAGKHNQEVGGKIERDPEGPEAEPEEMDPVVGQPAGKTRIGDVKGPEEDEPLVDGRHLAQQDCCRRQANKGHDVSELDTKEGRVGVGVRHTAVLHRESRRRPDDRHQPREPDEREAKPLVHREPFRADQEDLNREQREPADENGGVKMDDDGIGRLVLGDVLGYVSTEAA